MWDQAAINLDLAAYSAPVSVHFRSVTFDVKSSGRDNQILKGVSGNFTAGQLIGILGPSGSGKTTLLNVLSGFKFSGVRGTIQYNEEPLNETTQKKWCHVPRDSELLKNLSVLETMNSSVQLKLERNLPVNVRLKIINDILQMLGLDQCIHARVKKLSSGERKRLSIAIEMITNPAVLYFDEPTSGLGSSSSLQVMTQLRELAKAGRTVVCSIHQPSSRLLELIDVVYLMSDGQCLFNGSLEHMVHFFEQANFHCPPHYNRAEFALEVARKERYGDYEKLGVAGNDQNDRFPIQRGDGDGVEMQQMMGTGVDKRFDDQNGLIKLVPKRHNVNIVDQILILTVRSLRNSYRNLLWRIISTIIMALLLGSIFWRIGDTADHIISNGACLYLFLLFILLSNAVSTVVNCQAERKVFIREHTHNWYSIGAYVTSRIIFNLPLLVLSTTIFISIAYLMTGQPHEWQHFGALWLILILIAVVADSLGLFVGCACSVQMGTFMGCAIFIPNVLFSGFFIKYSELHVAYRPLYNLSFLRFGFEGSLNAIYGFGREELLCPRDFCSITQSQEVLKLAEMDGGPYRVMVMGICIWIVSMWFIVYITIRIKTWRTQR